MSKAATKPNLTQAVIHLIQSGQARTQQQITSNLSKQGLRVNQSSISRALRKVGAVKSLNAQGEAVYRIPQSISQIGQNQTIRHLVTDVISNEQLILIHTCTGSASVVAQLIDEQSFPELLGTLAGDNTILAAPKMVRMKSALEQKLADFFFITKE